MSQFAAQGSQGMLQQAQMGQAQNSTATPTYGINQWPSIAAPVSTTTGITGVGPYYTSPAKLTDVSPPPTAEVPIIDKSDKAGLFLRDEHGNLVHVETSKLFKAFGLEW